MTEIQIVQKSSTVEPLADEKINFDFTRESSGKVYFNSVEAISDFEAEAPVTDAISPVNPRLAAFLANAHILMNHREYSLALNLLRQACNLDSKNPRTLNLLASCLEQTGKDSEALFALKTLAKIERSFDNIFRYANSLYKLGRDQESLENYYDALTVLREENQHLFELYKNMGNIFVRQSDFDGAEEYYHKAYTLNSQSDVLLVNLGTLEVQRSDFDKSLYCFRKAVQINPKNDKAWVGLAMVHNHFGDIDLAWANIEAAVDINPQNRTAVHLAANWGLRDSKVSKAIDYLQVYLGAVDQDEDMSLVLINLLCSCGQLETAILEIERVLLWNPMQKEVHELKAKIIDTKKVA